MTQVFTESEAAAQILFDIRGEARDKRNRLKSLARKHMTQPGSVHALGFFALGSLSRAEPGSFFPSLSPTLQRLGRGAGR